VGPLGVLGFIPGYAQEQGLVSGEQFFILGLLDRLLGVKLPAAIFISFACAVLLGLALWCFSKSDDDPRSYLKRSLVLGTAFMVLFAPHFSWYFAWLVPFLCFVPLASLFYLTAACFILYGTWLGDKPEHVFRLKGFLYIPFGLLGAVELFVWRRSVALAKRQLPTVGRHVDGSMRE